MIKTMRAASIVPAWIGAAFAAVLAIVAGVAVVEVQAQLDVANRELARGIWKDLDFPSTEALTLDDARALWRLVDWR